MKERWVSVATRFHSPFRLSFSFQQTHSSFIILQAYSLHTNLVNWHAIFIKSTWEVSALTPSSSLYPLLSSKMHRGTVGVPLFSTCTIRLWIRPWSFMRAGLDYLIAEWFQGIRTDNILIWLDIVRPIHHMRRINNMMSETSIWILHLIILHEYG